VEEKLNCVLSAFYDQSGGGRGPRLSYESGGRETAQPAPGSPKWWWWPLFKFVEDVIGNDPANDLGNPLPPDKPAPPKPQPPREPCLPPSCVPA
jgi:hypothetical protein